MTKRYDGGAGEVHALRDVDVAMPAGKVTALMGPSGSGKTTLLRILAGLDRPDTGSVEIACAPMARRRRSRRTARRRQIGFVFQRPSDNLVSYLTVQEHMRLAAELRGAGDNDVTRMLESLGLSGRAFNRPHEMSGGEQQRLAFGQAAIGSPYLLLADEPTAELDAVSATALLSVIRSLANEKNAVVVATHDPQVADASDVVVSLLDGKVIG